MKNIFLAGAILLVEMTSSAIAFPVGHPFDTSEKKFTKRMEDMQVDMFMHESPEGNLEALFRFQPETRGTLSFNKGQNDHSEMLQMISQIEAQMQATQERIQKGMRGG